MHPMISPVPARSGPAANAARALPRLAARACVWLTAMLALALFAAFWLARFPIGREDHEARLAALDSAARADIDAGATPP